MTEGPMTGGDLLAAWPISVFLLWLRVAPVFLFAPPFTLTRAPKTMLALFGLGVAATLAGAHPDALVRDVQLDTLLALGAREAVLGAVPVLTLNILFGALYWVGRAIDVQAGFGLALLIDPATRGQVPLVGTIFGYLAGLVFFAQGGHQDLLRYFSASLLLLPLSAPALHLPALDTITLYLGTQFMIAAGVGGGAILALLLTDLGIAILSRTVPQLNALLLGVQVKTLVLLVALAALLGTAQALILRMVAANFDALAEMRF
jgi:flagellar biosynthesis protein FliR